MKGTISNRVRKNGASREQWQKRKQAFNAARPQQVIYEMNELDGVKIFRVRK